MLSLLIMAKNHFFSLGQMQIEMYIFVLKQWRSPETREWKECYKTVRKTTATKSSLVYRSSIQGNKVALSPGRGVK